MTVLENLQLAYAAQKNQVRRLTSTLRLIAREAKAKEENCPDPKWPTPQCQERNALIIIRELCDKVPELNGED